MKKICKLLTTTMLFITILHINVFAQQSTVKVGLETNFKNKTAFKIADLNLELHFQGVKGELQSSSGYSITVENNFYLKSNKDFNNYYEAAHEAALINYANSSVNACPVYIGGKFYVFGAGSASDTQTKGFATLFPNSSLVKGDNLVKIYGGSSNVMLTDSKNNFKITNKNNGPIDIDGKKYRGGLTFSASGGVMTAVNEVNVEEYLYSVLPSEMPASWHIEALKAQSVSARSYLYTSFGNHSKTGYDLCDTTHCQVYSGTKNETEQSTNAVINTKGKVAYYDDKPINAVFFSSSGGITDNSENAWVAEIPYLTSVVEINETTPKIWERSFTMEEMTQLATKAGGKIGTVTAVSISKIVNEHVLELTIHGTNGDMKIEKEKVRTFFSSSKDGSLHSRYFRINEEVPAINKTVTNNPSNNNNSNNSNNNNSQGLYIQGQDQSQQLPSSEIYTYNGETMDKLQEPINVINENETTVYESQNASNNNDLNNNAPSVDYQGSNSSATIGKKHSGTIVLKGKGWGHGVGLSQYGAKGMAEVGYTYDQILKHYYQGITIK